MKQQKANRISGRTVLAVGAIEVPIALFATTGKEAAAPKFVTAGPNGLALEKASALNGVRHKDAVAEAVPSSAAASVDLDPLGPSKPAAPVEAIEDRDEVTVETFEIGADKALDETEIRKGIRVGEDARFVDLTDRLDEIDKATVLDEMRIVGFVSRSSIEVGRVTGSYFLSKDPDADGGRVLALLWHAMREEKRAAVVTWSKRSKQSLGVLTARADGAMVVLEMAWAEQFRVPGPKALAHAADEVTTGEVRAARDLISAMSARPSLLDEQRDGRYVALTELVIAATDNKLDELERVALPPEPVENVTDLEELFASQTQVVAEAI